MKVSLQAEALQKKLSLLSRAVSPRPQLPILASILCVAKDNTLNLYATDLEIGIHTTLPAKVTLVGEIAIPARLFIDLITSLSKEEVTLEVKNKSLSITTPSSQSSIALLVADEFPTLYEQMGELYCRFDKHAFITSMEQIVFAASTDTGKPAFAGVLLRKEENEKQKGFLLVATDGFRLSLTHFSSSYPSSTTDTSLIIPAKFIKEVTSLKEDGNELEFYVSSLANQLLVKVGETLVVGRLVGSEYPPFEKIIPSDVSTTAIFSREELLKAVRICSVFARDSANVIKLALTKTGIIISSQAGVSGENNVTVSAKVTGEENEIAFNAKYLLDFLSAITDDDLIFEMIGPLNPGVFKIKNNPSYLHLIMPISLQE